ncbi:hypothetical protein HY989_03720 [Candidatus Micrarchaeota archaeon]|nr:hypothetical protein [Candidatus Micrarchaeota archaeon]
MKQQIRKIEKGEFAPIAKENGKEMGKQRIRGSPLESTKSIIEEIANMNLPVSHWKKMKKEIDGRCDIVQ